MHVVFYSGECVIQFLAFLSKAQQWSWCAERRYDREHGKRSVRMLDVKRVTLLLYESWRCQRQSATIDVAKLVLDQGGNDVVVTMFV